MAKIKGLIKDGAISEAKCSFCGGDAEEGGMWSGYEDYIMVCNGCRRHLIGLLVDTAKDDKFISLLSNDKQLELLLSEVKSEFIRKEGHSLFIKK